MIYYFRAAVNSNKLPDKLHLGFHNLNGFTEEPFFGKQVQLLTTVQWCHAGAVAVTQQLRLSSLSSSRQASSMPWLGVSVPAQPCKEH